MLFLQHTSVLINYMESTAEKWEFKINPGITMIPVRLSIFMFALNLKVIQENQD